MAEKRVEILSTEYITPDVKRFVLTKPKGFRFKPGQGCMVAVDEEGWRDKWRPFTFTNLPGQRKLELVVKIYAEHAGVTQHMAFLVSDVIMDEELTHLLGKKYLKIFTKQGVIGFRERRIDRDMLITLVQNFDQHFYLCGPPEFVNELEAMLLSLGAKPESLVFES